MEKKTTLIMLPQPILVSDEETSSGGWMFDTEQKIIHNPSRHNVTDYDIRIVAGIDGLPTLDLSLIAEEIGWVDVEKLAKLHCPDDIAFENMFIRGFNLSQSLNEKKYSEKDLFNLLKVVHDKRLDSLSSNIVDNGKVIDFNFWNSYSKKQIYASELINEFVQSLSKPKEYQVEVEMEDMLQTRHGDQWYDLPNQKEGREPDGIYQTVKRIKITNNTIKVIKIVE